MRTACGKRPVSTEDLRAATSHVERDLYQEFEDEVSTQEIGNRVMHELSIVDTVGYVRFASVYRQFATVAEFAEMVETVQREEALAPFAGLQESLL
jgi:transcriptional repressor NrdR